MDSLPKSPWIAVMIALLSTLAGCANQTDTVIQVKDDDPEMIAAIAKARASLPQFWQVFDNPANGESNFSLKVKITDSKGTEHFWATDIERKDGKIQGTINNDPNIVASVKLGDRIPIPQADISDWLYMKNGKMVGNETLKPLLKTLPPAEAETLRGMLANPDSAP